MKVFHSITDFKSNKKTIVTIGTFDGVHLGHQKILTRLLNSTLNNEFETLVLTFSQHPRSVLHAESNVKLLNSNSEKITLLEQKGIDNLIIQNFDTSFSNQTGEEFVKNILVDQLDIQKIIIGYDHKFGKNRSSDIHDLIYFGKKYHFDVEQISAQEIDAIAVSSTKIRKAILDGNIDLANQYLGYNFHFSGKVIAGKQLGRTIGFPTANLSLEKNQKILPKKGVYIVVGFWDDKYVNGIMNIGDKPTFNENKTTVEVHFINLDEDLYGKEITISILKFVREEIKFDGVANLKNQIEKDKTVAINYFSEINNVV